MPVQIRPTRLDVTDRFPMLGFNLRSSEGQRIVEIVLASDLALFTNREGRNSGTFYSSREHGTLTVPAGGSVFTVPPEVVARFIAADRLYVALASASAPAGQDWVVDVMPGPQSPYVSLRGLSDRALRRVRLFPAAPRSRMPMPGSVTEWAGDRVAAAPAPAAAPAVNPPANGANGAARDPMPYDDGFGPLPPLEPAPTSGAPAPAPAPSPTAVTEPSPAVASVPAAGQSFGGTSSSRWTTPRGFSTDGEEYQSSETYGIDGPTHVEDLPPAAQALTARARSPLTAAEYPGVTRIMPSPHFRRRAAGARTIERIVIHITSTPQRPSLGSGFMGTRVASAHYLVDQLGGIIQFVREQDDAFHARSANPTSIGIEHVAVQRGGARYGNTVFPYDPPTQIELETSAALVAHLCRKYGLEPNRTTIVGHAEADPTTTHTACPTGAWDWDPYMALVADCYARTPAGGVTSPVAPAPDGASGAAAQAHRRVTGLHHWQVGHRDRPDRYPHHRRPHDIINRQPFLCCRGAGERPLFGGAGW
jgi:N-acetyl-anhydromuramyl-L-alanine amidase AmpD